MINYLLKSGILLLVFYAVYKLWLENEKMLRFNRAYLLLSLLFSLIVPLQLFAFEPFLGDKLNTIQLEGIMIKTNNVIQDKMNIYEIMTFVLILIYVGVSLLLTLRFTRNIYAFYRELRSNKMQLINGEKVILVEELILPHSFWNTIFISKEEFEKNKIPSELIAHEKAHLNQKHTLDILFIEVLQIVFWFNPIIILYKKAIKLNHEFLADQAVNNQFNSVVNYQNLLLEIASNKTNIALASTINYQITKKRFLMMTKKESPIKVVFKAFSIAVISALLLFVFSSKSSAQIDKKKTKVPDGFSVGFDSTNVKQPEFPGGMVEFYKFVGQNFKTPAEATKNNIEGKLGMKFTIEKDGSVSEVIIVNDLGYGLGKEAARVLNLSPKWIPASEKGKPVRVQYDLPITIKKDK